MERVNTWCWYIYPDRFFFMVCKQWAAFKEILYCQVCDVVLFWESCCKQQESQLSAIISLSRINSQGRFDSGNLALRFGMQFLKEGFACQLFVTTSAQGNLPPQAKLCGHPQPPSIQPFLHMHRLWHAAVGRRNSHSCACADLTETTSLALIFKYHFIHHQALQNKSLLPEIFQPQAADQFAYSQGSLYLCSGTGVYSYTSYILKTPRPYVTDVSSNRQLTCKALTLATVWQRVDYNMLSETKRTAI